jgi:hypothetical protein
MRESGIGYSLTVGSTTLTINGGAGATSFSGSGWFAAPDGVNFQTQISTPGVTRPQQHGSYLDAGWRDGIAGSFTLYNMGETAALRQSQADDLVEVLNLMSGDSGLTGTLTWTMPGDSSQRQISGIYLTQQPAFSTVGGMLKSVSFIVQSERPFAESASATNTDTTTFAASGGGFTVPLTIPFTFTASGAGTTTVSNTGSVDALPIVRVYGPISAFTLTLTATGYTAKRLAFASGSIASGDYWDVDLLEKTVTLNGGTTSMISALDLTTSSWFGFPPGDSTLQLTGSGYDTSNTKARVLMRSAWA